MCMSAIIKENCELIAFLRGAIRDASWQTPSVLMIHPKEICCWAGSTGDILGKPGRKTRLSWHTFPGALYLPARATTSEKPFSNFPSVITLMRPKYFVDISGMFLSTWDFNYHSMQCVSLCCQTRGTFELWLLYSCSSLTGGLAHKMLFVQVLE